MRHISDRLPSLHLTPASNLYGTIYQPPPYLHSKVSIRLPISATTKQYDFYKQITTTNLIVRFTHCPMLLTDKPTITIFLFHRRFTRRTIHIHSTAEITNKMVML